MDTLKLTVIQTIETQLMSFGFSYVNKHGWFHRKREYGVDYYVPIFVDIGNGYEVTLTAALHINRIEDLFHKTSGIDKKAQKDFFTLGIDFWRLYGREKYVFRVSDEPSAATAGRELKNIFEEHAVAFYDRFSDVARIDEALNSAPQEPCIYRLMPWLRASTGVISSKLSAQGNYDGLVSVYREQMKSLADGFYLPRFDSLITSLEGL